MIEKLVYAEIVPLKNSMGEEGEAQYRKLGILHEAKIEGKKPIRAFVDRARMKNGVRKTGVGHPSTSDTFGAKDVRSVRRGLLSGTHKQDVSSTRPSS